MRYIVALAVVAIFASLTVATVLSVRRLYDASSNLELLTEQEWHAAREKNCRAQAYKLANRVDGKTFTTGPVERAYEECLESH